MSHLCLHGVADGDIALHGEGGEGEGGHVDAQILTVHKGTAPHATPDPSDQKILNMNESLDDRMDDNIDGSVSEIMKDMEIKLDESLEDNMGESLDKNMDESMDENMDESMDENSPLGKISPAVHLELTGSRHPLNTESQNIQGAFKIIVF